MSMQRLGPAAVRKNDLHEIIGLFVFASAVHLSFES